MKRPFVIAVASEKGGVGKTTIATNLAVYLKALREELPVTIASFDNHFSVDQMFLLGPRPEQGVAALLEGQSAEALAVLGQYGVQYLASARRLSPPAQLPVWLRRQLHASELNGILILDTRPILDWFTEAALLAADLVLVPIKDRAALINADALRQLLVGAKRADRLWLLPSLVDTRARLNSEVRVHEFLIYAAKERDYQLLDFCISKSPKVESLASGFSSRIWPVLTHARNTAVHGQLKLLAEFALSHFDAESTGGTSRPAPALPAGPYKGQRRLVPECPLCRAESLAGVGHFYFDLRSRRCGFMHPACFERLFSEINLNDAENFDGLLALTLDGPGRVGPECLLTAHFCEADGEVVGSAVLALDEQSGLGDALRVMSGRSLDEAYRELLLISHVVQSTEAQLTAKSYRTFALMRRKIARELRHAGLF